MKYLHILLPRMRHMWQSKAYYWWLSDTRLCHRWSLCLLHGHSSPFLKDVSLASRLLSPTSLLPWIVMTHYPRRCTFRHLLSQFLGLLSTVRIWLPPYTSSSLSCHTADIVPNLHFKHLTLWPPHLIFLVFFLSINAVDNHSLPGTLDSFTWQNSNSVPTSATTPTQLKVAAKKHSVMLSGL